MSLEPRKRIHEQPDLCSHILGGITKSDASLRIDASSILGAGSGLFVDGDVKAGSEIFKSQPLLVVCEGNNRGVCDYCFLNRNSSVRPDGRFYVSHEDRANVKLSTCSGCKIAEYCSKECQKKAWKSYHKLECPVLHQIYEFNKNLGPVPRALCRLVLWIENMSLSMADCEALAQLETCFKERNDDWYKVHDDGVPPTFMVASNIRQATAPDGPDSSKRGPSLTVNSIQLLYCMLLSNAGAICPPEADIQYGCFLDLAVSTINHSCDANAHIFFEGRELRCRALVDVPAGTEVTLHYYPSPRLDVLLRRGILHESMFIKCNCKRCKDEMAEHVAAAVHRRDHLAKFKQAQSDLLTLGEDAEKTFARTPLVQSCITFQDQIGKIVEEGFPGGQWPNHIEPLPSIYCILGGMYRDLHYVVGLEFVLKGTLYLRDHSGPRWTNDLMGLVKYMFFVAQANDDEIKWVGAVENAELLERSTMRDVARAYLALACVDGRHTFGLNSNFVRALYHWAAESIEFPGDLDFRGDAFRERFKDSQERLLSWANVKGDRGLALPSKEKLDELAAAISARRAERALDLTS